MEVAVVLKLINFIQAGYAWLAARGVHKDRVQFLIDRAVAENRDVTTDEVQQELDATQAELDETAGMVDGLPED